METTPKRGGFPPGSAAQFNTSDFLAGEVHAAEGHDRKPPKMENTNVLTAQMARSWEANLYISRAL